MNLYIATLAELKTMLGITDTGDDSAITQMAVAIQGRFDSHCRRQFLYAASQTEYLDGGVSELLVHRWPIASIASIIVDIDQAWSTDDALASTDYRLNMKRGKIVYGTGTYPWPEGFQNIRVVYAGGFVKSDGTAADHVEAGDLETLRRGFLMQVGYEWRNKEILGITQISQNGASVQAGAGVALALKGMTLMPEVELTLQPLKRTV